MPVMTASPTVRMAEMAAVPIMLVHLMRGIPHSVVRVAGVTWVVVIAVGIAVVVMVLVMDNVAKGVTQHYSGHHTSNDRPGVRMRPRIRVSSRAHEDESNQHSCYGDSLHDLHLS